ncbi:MAG: zinc-binding alcohol dehydrogenase family protein [Rhizomicrobium sp.]
MTSNEAAWLTGPHPPLKVGPAPYTEPGAGEILIRNHAVAVNPVDWFKPYIGDRMFSWIKYPFVLGSDLAGEVVAVGSGVTDMKAGDRVLAMAAGPCQSRNRAAEGAFQRYTITLPRLTAVIPDFVSYEQAAVIPLGITTAACGLYQKDLLALALPTDNTTPRDQWLIVWGGATSVGCNAIQLGKASGYKVMTTSSPKNFTYVKSLGADIALDYNSKTVASDIVAALQGKEVVGALAIGAGSTEALLGILAKCRGRKFIASCSAAVALDKIATGDRINLAAFLRILPAVLRATIAVRTKSRWFGVREKFFDASSVVDNEVGPAIYRDYLGKALAAGTFRPAPPAKVVGNSLQDIEKAFAIQRQGVSASKIVVRLG